MISSVMFAAAESTLDLLRHSLQTDGRSAGRAPHVFVIMGASVRACGVNSAQPAGLHKAVVKYKVSMNFV